MDTGDSALLQDYALGTPHRCEWSIRDWLLVGHLKAGDRLRIGGLGTMEVKNRPARTGRNPSTGATIQIAASKKIAFRPAKELKEAI